MNYIKIGIGLIVVSLAGKVIGLLKQIVIAWAFGATNVTDTYFIADGAVAMVTVVVAGALSTTLLSFYSKKLDLSIEERKKLIGNVLGCSIVFSAMLAVVILAFSMPLAGLLAPGLAEEEKVSISNYLRILSISTVIIVLSSLFGAFLEGEDEFLAPKLQSIFVSVTTIILVILLRETKGVYSIIGGYFGGYCIHCIFVARRLQKKGLLSLTVPRYDQDIRTISKMAAMVIVGNSVVEINHLIDKTIASGLETGSISALYYGQIVSTDLVIATLVYSVGSIFIRDFSRLVAEKKIHSLQNSIKKVAGIYLPVGVICLILYIFFSVTIITILLKRGNFDDKAVELTRQVVLGYSPCFIIVPIKDVLMKTHYAMLDSKRPMTICIIESFFNILISYFLSKEIGLLGIALGTSLSSLIAIVLFHYSTRRYLPELRIFSRRQVISVAFAGAGAIGMKLCMDLFLQNITLFQQIMIALLIVICYVSLLYFIKCPYIHDEIKRLSIIVKTRSKR